jgi:hypothetical protein
VRLRVQAASGESGEGKCPKVLAEACPKAEWHCVSRDNDSEFTQGMIQAQRGNPHHETDDTP